MAKFVLNGKSVEVDAEPDVPLLWIIREHLELTGTKFGCGMALCGACTVHLNGAAIRSCVTPVAAVEGQVITTIEGLSDVPGQHPLQKAWVNNNVPQCGYCQSGQIMQAAALLAQNPSPSSSEIDTAMQGNICRCGTYPRIKRAITEAVQNQAPNGGKSP
jgi:isoquinoline 1-oxidoreductase subunit alpha